MFKGYKEVKKEGDLNIIENVWKADDLGCYVWNERILPTLQADEKVIDMIAYYIDFESLGQDFDLEMGGRFANNGYYFYDDGTDVAFW